MIEPFRDPHVWLTIALVALVGAVPATSEWGQWRHDAQHSGEATPVVPVHEPGVGFEHVADQHPIAAPVVTEVDGEARTVTTTYPAGQGETGSVYLLDENGTVLWEQTPSPTTTGGFVAAPAIVEDDDGTAVLAAKAEDSTLYRLDIETGQIENSWQMGQSNQDLLVSPPTVANVTGDAEPEVVIGGSEADDDGSVFVLDSSLNTVLFEKELNAPVWSSPLVEDLDDDGGTEITVSTGVPDAACVVFGTLHPVNDPETGDDKGRLYVFEHDTGSLDDVWDAPLEGPTHSSPASADLDDDGSTEIVVGSQGPRGGCTDVTSVQTDGHLEVFGANGARVDAIQGSLVLSVTTPVVSDLGGDGTLEIVHGAWNGIRAQRLTSSGLQQTRAFEIEADDRHDQDHWVLAAPSLVDLDGDGGRDVVGMSIPIDINADNPANSDVKPGAVFAVSPATDHSAIDAGLGPLTVDTHEFEARWVHPTPEDGGLGGPVAADANGDDLGEIVFGTGFPVIGDSTTTRSLGNLNPVVKQISTDPPEPTTADEITFDPAVVDQDHGPGELDYSWDFGHGDTSTDRRPVYSYDDDGEYPVTVTVTDPDGHTWKRTTTRTVTNLPPETSGSVDTTPGSLEARFTATAMDPDGTVEATGWTFGDGEKTTTPDRTDPNHTYATGGTYQATFTATDDDGDARTLERTVNVNRFPTLTGADEARAGEGDRLTVSLDYADPDGDPGQVVDVDGVPTATARFTDADTVTITWTPPFDVATRDTSPAVVPLAVTVEDGGLPSGTDTHEVSVAVSNTNRAPTVRGPAASTATVGRTATIEGTVGDPDGNPITTSARDLPSYASFERTGTTWTITVNPPTDVDPTTRDVTITADDGVATSQRTVTITVLENLPPTVTIEGPDTVEPTTRWEPNPLTFDGRADDPEDEGIAQLTWTLGDRLTHGSTFMHAFREHGTYTIGLVAEDDQGETGSTTHTVTVDDALTGDLVVHPSSTSPNSDRIVGLLLRYTDRTPLDRYPATVTVTHEGLNETTFEKTVTTDDDGLAQVRIDGDLGLPAFVPGEHRVTVDATADSLPGAPIQGPETVRMERTFWVER